MWWECLYYNTLFPFILYLGYLSDLYQNLPEQPGKPHEDPVQHVQIIGLNSPKPVTMLKTKIIGEDNNNQDSHCRICPADVQDIQSILVE